MDSNSLKSSPTNAGLSQSDSNSLKSSPTNAGLSPDSLKSSLINAGLSAYHQFLLWYPVQNPESGKFDKIPCHIDNNGNPQKINAYDPHNFMDLETAIAWMDYGRKAAGIDYGIGFSFTPDDDLVFIDYDGVCDPNTGQWVPVASDAVSRFQGAFLEVSMSGTGLHVIATATLSKRYKTRSKAFPGEIYQDGRFIALTGLAATGNVQTDITQALEPYMVHFGFQAATGEASQTIEYMYHVDPAYTFEGDDDTLIDAMKQSRGSAAAAMGDKCHVWDLWEAYERKLRVNYPAEGRKDGLSYDRSAAAAALMCHLAYWTGKNPERMARLFKRSKLYSPEKHDPGNEYHIRKMLGYAVKGCTAVYNIAQSEQKRPLAGYLSTSDQVELFSRCVYIIHHDKIYTPEHGLLKTTQFNAVYGGHEFQMDPHGKTTKKAWEAFTENRIHQFPVATDTYFDPRDEPGYVRDGCVNVWEKPDIKLIDGDPTPFLNHVKRILPNGDDADILLTWMQAVARYPGEKALWAPVIQGTEGNGKTILSDVLADAVGREYFHVPRPEQLGKEQNAWLLYKRLGVVEEIRINERREALEVLKPIITNKYVEIRDMRVTAETKRNFINLMFFTNYKDAIPITTDTRRYCVFYTNQQNRNDMIRDGLLNPDGQSSDYFKWLYDWLNNQNGREIVINFLLNYPIVNEKYNPANGCVWAPSTTSTCEVLIESLTGFQRDILEATKTTVTDTAIVDGVPRDVEFIGEKGFRGNWINTACIEIITDSKIHTKTMNTRLTELGYNFICKSTIKQITGKRGSLYYKGELPKLTAAEYTKLYLDSQNIPIN